MGSCVPQAIWRSGGAAAVSYTHLDVYKRQDMTLLEKIIYLADYIEPTRDCPGVEALRRTVYEDLDRGLLMGLTMTIDEMEEMCNPVHHMTRDARD